ncbi:Limonoid UDP-glucosyltransferase [Dichanthelium oligosanthes]|uniref:Glycosyltransferase n=1 Tax=Dichanthelium oligosanthes TaxID=888268 RepID=A0A1E5W3Z8_9POAL|nr:Limonoid UDP-glucosyltransferase [Dichanthelium oligosanthes]
MSSSPPPHVLLVSAPLQGHVNPLLVLGRRLASRGLLVTFSTVPHAGLKFSHGDGEAVNVGRGTLRFEHLQGGGLWSSDDPRYRESDVMRHLEDAAPAALSGLIRRQSEAGRAVSCVVANAFAPWVVRVASAMGVPHAMLWTESCAVLSLFYHYFHSLADFPSKEAEPNAPVAVPGLPSKMAAGDLPALIHAPEQFIWRQVLVEDLRSLRETVSWALVNTFDELEHPTIEALRPHLPIIPVGPLCETESYGDRDDDCAAWLDAQPPRSVVFVAFGSLLKISRDELTELAEGLEATGRPFLLVVRDDNRELLPDDCLAAATDGSRGKVVAWCEQGQVLSHGAVGCFVTHCGWNSTLEALACGVPVVTYPAWADQPTNAKFLADVYGVGVRLPKPMARDALRRCVEEVMSGPEAAAMRARAGKWKAEASSALSNNGGSSDRAIQEFVNAVLSIGPNGY